MPRKVKRWVQSHPGTYWQMLDTDPMSLHWRPLAHKEVARPIKVRNERQEEVKVVHSLHLNWVRWWLSDWFWCSSPLNFQVLFYFPDKTSHLFVSSFSPNIAVCINTYDPFVFASMHSLCTSLIQFHQNGGTPYANFKFSFLKICAVIMHKHHYFHFINGQSTENWTLHYFKVDTWEIFLRSTNGMHPMSI